MNELNLALELLGVGMTTVFVILALVVVIGNLIIRFVNRFIPEEVQEVVKKVEKAVGPDRKKMAAIVSAVNIVTNGKGKVTNIEKI
jgi:oxaloacetate decarboxylase gamma subunit